MELAELSKKKAPWLTGAHSSQTAATAAAMFGYSGFHSSTRYPAVNESCGGCKVWWHMYRTGGHLLRRSLFCVAAKVENQCFVGGFMVLTLFALFVPDLDLLLGTVETQQLLSPSAQMTGYFGLLQHISLS